MDQRGPTFLNFIVALIQGFIVTLVVPLVVTLVILFVFSGQIEDLKPSNLLYILGLTFVVIFIFGGAELGLTVVTALKADFPLAASRFLGGLLAVFVFVVFVPALF